MAAIAPGARIQIRGEEWIVRNVDADAAGREALSVVGTSELVRDREAIFLTALDSPIVLRPEDVELVEDDTARYRKSRLYLEALLRRTPPTDDRIHLGHLGAIDPLPFQLDPAAKALAQLRPRILMADGVGLGKTIEVGVLLSELIRRGRGRRILVVAMKSILEQFQEELWARFTIPLVRLDSVGVQRVQSRVPSNMNPFHYFDRVIVSVDTLKNDAKYRQYLENCRWDAIVVDECQNVAMRKSNSQRAALAQLISGTCDSLILTSATPHDGSAESFASLMRLLEPTALANEAEFTKEEVQHLFLRRFKKDISDQLKEVFPERKLDQRKLEASLPENAFFERIAEADFKTVDRSSKSKGVLFRTLLLKAFLSSPAACLSTMKKRLQHKDLQVEQLDGEKRANAESDRALLNDLIDLASRVSESTFTKYQELLKLLKKNEVVGKDPAKRVVVFSERIDTLEFLSERLQADLGLKEKQVAIFNGQLKDRDQTILVKNFGTKASPIRVLLASEAAAEGINLHYFCHRLVHFDLPWSLITMVQRNGRIDRYGQKNTPWIHYLLTIPSNEEVKGDLRVLERLIEKEAQVQKNLGDPSCLMNLHSKEAEEEEITKAVQGEKSADEVLPDEPRSNEKTDWFTQFYEAAASDQPAAVTADPLTLFPDDLEYAREAFEEAVPGAEGCVTWHDHLKGFEIHPPDDLRRRYDYLPPELRRDRERFKLTVDRERVMNAIEEAREHDKQWPEWELFWPQHPISSWLDDRVLSAFGRHEAPVLELDLELDKGEVCFVFQGIYSNRRSQPVIVEWFVIPMLEMKAQTPLSFKQLVERIVSGD